MSTTLLAVDDSVTMRKVLEITFSGEDFQVLTAEGSQDALAQLGQNPSVCLIDTVLGGEDGYALAKEIRNRAPGAAIILLSSRYNPFDQARGRDAGADDYADKPFDTQQLIDKVKKAAAARASGGGAVAAAPAAPAAAPQAPPAPRPQPVAAAPQPAPAAPRPQPAAASANRTGTLVFGDSPAAAPSASPRPPIARPAAAPATSTHVSAGVSAAVNGQLAGKLDGLGLTPDQANAVLALSREVVERVVWEVVPHLAETLIKEEITRLTRE